MKAALHSPYRLFLQILCGQRASSEALLCLHHHRNDLHLHRCGFNSKYRPPSRHSHRDRCWHVSDACRTCVKGAGFSFPPLRISSLAHMRCNPDFLRILWDTVFAKKSMDFWQVCLVFLALGLRPRWISCVNTAGSCAESGFLST